MIMFKCVCMSVCVCVCACVCVCLYVCWCVLYYFCLNSAFHNLPVEQGKQLALRAFFASSFVCCLFNFVCSQCCAAMLPTHLAFKGTGSQPSQEGKPETSG